MPHRLALALLVALPLAACQASTDDDAAGANGSAGAQPAPARPSSQTLPSALGTVRVTEVVRGLKHPWSVAFLPDGSMLVTERPGQLRRVAADGALSAPISGVPAVFATGQGGLLDVVPAPDFATSQRIYLSYAEPGADGTAGTAVAHATLAGDALTDVTVIYRQEPKVVGPNHFGSRLVFDGNGHLFISQGERNQRPLAQELDKLQGKLVRLNLDGSVPQDNPFVGQAGARPEIYSYGHRNMQGMAQDPRTGKLWQNEHGPRGGDEINLPQPGRNYGWPVITHGINYSGQPIPEAEGKAKDGMEPPHHVWEKSPGLSGMAFYTGRPGNPWNDSLFMGALAERNLIRLTLDGDRIVNEERLLNDIGERVRDVRVGPDDNVYVLTDEEDGKLWRIEPPKSP
jgi:glucose/arabinose dehydrogenase